LDDKFVTQAPIERFHRRIPTISRALFGIIPYGQTVHENATIYHSMYGTSTVCKLFLNDKMIIKWDKAFDPQSLIYQFSAYGDMQPDDSLQWLYDTSDE
jgi:hypothetical protein